MNEKTKNAAVGLFLVTYRFAAANGSMRSGQLAIEAKDANEARNIAEDKIETFGLRYPKISAVKPY